MERRFRIFEYHLTLFILLAVEFITSHCQEINI